MHYLKTKNVVVFTKTYESDSFDRIFLKGLEYSLTNVVASWFIKKGYAKYSERWSDNKHEIHFK